MAIAAGSLRPPPKYPVLEEIASPVGRNSERRDDPRFATHTLPAASMAMPCGSLRPPPENPIARVKSYGAAARTGANGGELGSRRIQPRDIRAGIMGNVDGGRCRIRRSHHWRPHGHSLRKKRRAAPKAVLT